MSTNDSQQQAQRELARRYEKARVAEPREFRSRETELLGICIAAFLFVYVCWAAIR